MCVEGLLNQVIKRGENHLIIIDIKEFSLDTGKNNQIFHKNPNLHTGGD